MSNSSELRLAELGGECVSVQGNELAKTLDILLQEANGRIAYHLPQMSAVLPKRGEYFEIGSRPDSRSGFKRQLANCKAGIVAADYFLKDTGTLVFLQPGQPSRLLTLLPEWLITIVSGKNMLPDLPALYQIIDSEKDIPFFMTGPSRTADIEKQLVLGVHGPKRLTVLILEDDQTDT